MASSGKSVDVLCPNGRRQKVTVTPGMTVFQILQEVCTKQGFDETKYDLKHHQKFLSVTSMLRYLNIANNAKLEMVECVKPRSASNVTVALQLEDGVRLQKDFDPVESLKSVLESFQTESGGELLSPKSVCVYMRNEYKGLKMLASTTLQSMGITNGRAALRLLFRDVNIDEEPLEVGAEEAAAGNDSKEKATEEPDSKKQKLQQEAEARWKHDGTPNVTMSQCVYGPPNREIFPPAVVRRRDDRTLSDSLPTNSFKYNSLPEKAVPNEFSEFKFPEKLHKNNDSRDDLAIDPDLLKTEVRLGMPCDRKTICYKSEEKDESLEYSVEEVSDQFFEVTINDIRKRMTDLKSQRHGDYYFKLVNQEEALLLTQAARRRRELEKISSFSTIPIRFQLPDKTVVQAFFRPLETVSALKTFIKQCLSQEVKKFDLFTTPPKTIFKDNSQTLYDAKLFPAALIYIATYTKASPYLKDEYISLMKTYEEAEVTVQNAIKRSALSISSHVAVHSSGVTTDKKTELNPSSTTTRLVSASISGNPVKSKNAPKWFKTGR